MLPVTFEAADGGSGSQRRRLLESLFVHKDAVIKHLAAPMLDEREAYLSHLLVKGCKRAFVIERASTLFQVVRLLVPIEIGLVSEEDIMRASASWASSRPPANQIGTKPTGSHFRAVARSWCRYLGIYGLQLNPANRIQQALPHFVRAMTDDLGYLPSSVQSCTSSVKRFLAWVSVHRETLEAISLTDVDAFLAERISLGSKQRTIEGHARALRVFFRYAERHGWSNKALSRSVRAPSTGTRYPVLECPTWRQVRRLLASLDASKPSHCRAKAILLLASVYGLRRSEIVRLTLEDLDWQNEVLTVRRSKHGRIQQFPLQSEVGEAIIHYLRDVRPPSRSRSLFLTLQHPPRSAMNMGPAMRKVLDSQKVFDRSYGMHALRHACATELLRQGTSLHGIADFLGHRSLESVSIYAHCATPALRRVGDFELQDVL